jgi:hypothetical protein
MINENQPDPESEGFPSERDTLAHSTPPNDGGTGGLLPDVSKPPPRGRRDDKDKTSLAMLLQALDDVDAVIERAHFKSHFLKDQDKFAIACTKAFVNDAQELLTKRGTNFYRLGGIFFGLAFVVLAGAAILAYKKFGDNLPTTDKSVIQYILIY